MATAILFPLGPALPARSGHIHLPLQRGWEVYIYIYSCRSCGIRRPHTITLNPSPKVWAFRFSSKNWISRRKQSNPSLSGSNSTIWGCQPCEPLRSSRALTLEATEGLRLLYCRCWQNQRGQQRWFCTGILKLQNKASVVFNVLVQEKKFYLHWSKRRKEDAVLSFAN